MMSIKEIAKLAGVSPSTVSRVVNNKKWVKPQLRESILALVRETGYVANNAARSMVLKRTFTIGIVIPDTFNMFQRQLFSIIEHDLEVYGYRTLFFFIKWEPESEFNCLRKLKAENVDGIIMLHELNHPDVYAYLTQASLPVVLCTFGREELGFHSVHVDEEAAARTATEYLIQLGHRRIALISGTHFSFASQRAAGYRMALESAGIPYDEARVISAVAYNPEEGRRSMWELLERGGEFSALFAITDELAIGALRTLYEAGLNAPQDISIIGVDDIDIAGFVAPGLSTVRQPIQAMGKKTAEIMSQLIAGEDCGAHSHVFAHQLVIRESCDTF
jgi:LacI family transcriptional regulator